MIKYFRFTTRENRNLSFKRSVVKRQKDMILTSRIVNILAKCVWKSDMLPTKLQQDHFENYKLNIY